MKAVEELEHVLEVQEVNVLRNPNPKVYRKRINSFEKFSDRDFRNRYRLSKDAVRFVIKLVSQKLESPVYRATNSSPAIQVLVALRYFAKGCYQLELEICMDYPSLQYLELYVPFQKQLQNTKICKVSTTIRRTARRVL